MATPIKKRKLKKGQTFLLIIIVIILLSIFLQKMGFPIMQKTDNTEIIEDPHPGY